MPVSRRWLPFMGAAVDARMFKTFVLRAMFTAWRAMQMDSQVLALKADAAHMQQMIGKQVQSIWMMRKATLIETALREVPKTQRDQITAMRKDEIQLLIRKHRDEAAVTKAFLPPGLARMRHQELVQEAAGRGIETADSTRRYGIKTRGQLLEDIRIYEGEMVRIGATRTSFPDADEDFYMEGPQASQAWSQVPHAPPNEDCAQSSPLSPQEVQLLFAIRNNPHVMQTLMNQEMNEASAAFLSPSSGSGP